ncbi:MAG TPA: mechanosensitive ion channel domain-containing protein [Candidatus Sphingobacterium stercoripullorum]|nr:mechanosensitive ion channel domain-containing protein [Candidatus Sphingobacterium stercoripullorum]
MKILEMVNSFRLGGIYEWLTELLNNAGINEKLAYFIVFFILVGILLGIYYIAKGITHYILNAVVSRIVAKTPTVFDDILLKNNTLKHFSRVAPLILILNIGPIILTHYTLTSTFLKKSIDVALVIIWVLFFRAIFRSIRDYLNTKDSYRDKPLDSYLQVVNIIMYFIAGIIIFTLVTGYDTMTFLGTLGAASAVLMLVFKDTIMGFVASIQVATNDMVRIGDWIEMPKYGADGDVIEINLNTVKIQNFDKTITTVPTYFLITDSFKNWRGMQNAGGRRIKRAINIKISSIRYLTEKELDTLSEIELLTEFIKCRREEIQKYNINQEVNKSVPVNGRHLTNIGLFRKYVSEYVNKNDFISKEMSLMVRHLAPDEKGLPIELYMFVNDVRWVKYEDVMADIFDHLLAATQYFYLEVFELPSSGDIRSLHLNTTKSIES